MFDLGALKIVKKTENLPLSYFHKENENKTCKLTKHAFQVSYLFA
jgi:hypothetical protein